MKMENEEEEELVVREEHRVYSSSKENKNSLESSSFVCFIEIPIPILNNKSSYVNNLMFLDNASATKSSSLRCLPKSSFAFGINDSYSSKGMNFILLNNIWDNSSISELSSLLFLKISNLCLRNSCLNFSGANTYKFSSNRISAIFPFEIKVLNKTLESITTSIHSNPLLTKSSCMDPSTLSANSLASSSVNLDLDNIFFNLLRSSDFDLCFMNCTTISDISRLDSSACLLNSSGILTQISAILINNKTDLNNFRLQKISDIYSKVEVSKRNQLSRESSSSLSERSSNSLILSDIDNNYIDKIIDKLDKRYEKDWWIEDDGNKIDYNKKEFTSLPNSLACSSVNSLCSNISLAIENFISSCICLNNFSKSNLALSSNPFGTSNLRDISAILTLDDNSREVFKYFGSTFFSGSIDSVLIFNRSLSASEVYQIYASNLQKYNSTQWYLYVNQSKNATTGLDYATYTYFASAKNYSGSENKTETRSIEIANSPSGKKFIITNKSGDNVASFDDKGDIYLKGTASQSQSSLSPTANSFIVQNSTGTIISYINNSGYMFILGTYTESSDLSGLTSSNLEIRNSTNNLVAFFDNLGNLKLKGNLAENYGAP